MLIYAWATFRQKGVRTKSWTQMCRRPEMYSLEQRTDAVQFFIESGFNENQIGSKPIWKPCRAYLFAKIFVPYLTTAYGQPEKSLISCGFTRLDLFTSTCFCLSWCVTASVISGANGFWLRSILNPPTAKADRAENRIRRYEGEPAYRLLRWSVYRLVVVLWSRKGE